MEDRDLRTKKIADEYLWVIWAVIKKYQNSLPYGLTKEDCYSAAYQVLIEAAEKYEDNFNTIFSTYAYYCIKRRVITMIMRCSQKEQRSGFRIVRMHEDQQYSSPSQVHPLRILEARETAEEIHELVNCNFTKIEKEVYGFMIKGFKSLEIAKAIGKDVKVVQNTVWRIRRKIKKNLTKS